MSRQKELEDAFKSYQTHPWLKKPYAKLKLGDRAAVFYFIQKNAALSKGDFEKAINRMFLDKDKPKNWTVILELLTCANSRVG